MGKDKSMYLVKDSKRGFLRIMFLWLYSNRNKQSQLQISYYNSKLHKLCLTHKNNSNTVVKEEAIKIMVWFLIRQALEAEGFHQKINQDSPGQ
jgi:hypothetical protein